MRPLTFTGVAMAAALLAGLAAAGVSGPPAPAPDGATTFAQNCSACHQLDGKGVPGAFPSLAGDPFVQGVPDKVALTLLNGRGGMPAFKDDLSDAQISAAIGYIRSAWGNHAPPVGTAMVARLRGGGSPQTLGAGLQAH